MSVWNKMYNLERRNREFNIRIAGIKETKQEKCRYIVVSGYSRT